MNRIIGGLLALYTAGFAMSLVGCSSDNIPKGTIRSGIGVPSSITLEVIGAQVVTGLNVSTGQLREGLFGIESNSAVPFVATVKDELGNPSEGYSVIFTSTFVNAGAAGVAPTGPLIKGQAISNQTFNVSTSAIPIGFGPKLVTVTAQVDTLTASIDVLVNCTNCNRGRYFVPASRKSSLKTPTRRW